MKITKQTKLSDFQQMFRIFFPHLKLMFFINKHSKFAFSPFYEEILCDYTMEEINANFNDNEIMLTGEETVADFEARMENDFGIHVQVLRKAGDAWVQTTATDSWTLMREESCAY